MTNQATRSDAPQSDAVVTELQSGDTAAAQAEQADAPEPNPASAAEILDGNPALQESWSSTATGPF